MKNGKNIIITIFGIISSFTCLSQNIPFGALPLDINSSFAGEGDAPRLSSNFSLYLQHTDRKEVNYDIRTSYDQFIP